MEADNLKEKATHAFLWSATERIGQQGVQFVISIILARLLLPEEFGLIAMLTIFMAISQSLINSGFGQALIQKKNSTYVDECSIFYFNILVGFLAAGILCLAAPQIGIFYNQPLLPLLTYALSLNLVINSLGLVQTTLLTKRLDFKTQAKVSMSATVISGSIGVTMAFNGYGVWSLVVQSLSSNLLSTALLWSFNSWRPSMIFSFSALRQMFTFGSRLLAAGLLNTLFDNIYLVVIGKLFSPGVLGFYTRAYGLQQLPVANLSNIISRVTFPVFSSVQSDKDRLKRGVRETLSMLVLINFPMMIGLAVVANPLVRVLLTEKWLPCVPFLQLLCVVGMLYPLHVINLNVLNAQGRSDLFFRLEVVKKVLIVIVIIITYRWGIIAMIYGQIVTSIFSYFLNSYFTGKILNYPVVDQIADLMPSLIISLIMGTLIYSIKYLGITSSAILLLTQIITGIFSFFTICYLLRVPAFLKIIEIAKTTISSEKHV